MSRDEMLLIAREVCDRLGARYDNPASPAQVSRTESPGDAA